MSGGMETLVERLIDHGTRWGRQDEIEAASAIQALIAERDRLRSAAQAAYKSVGRFPGSVHDQAMAKLERALGPPPYDYPDHDHRRAEASEARVKVLEVLLEGRDKFIVDSGLWLGFVDTLPQPALRNVKEAGNG